MKIVIVVGSIILIIFIGFQSYASIASTKSETQVYTVILKEEEFEIRYYPSAVIAKITSTFKSYKEMGSYGFSKLAKYIFGGNSEKKTDCNDILQFIWI
jgi:uncharacterized membrane protein